MNTCLAVGAMLLHLSGPEFTLAWTHSVEKVEWQESWLISDTRLTLQSSRIKGSGAGMEPAPDAVLRDGWWVSNSTFTVSSLTLAASGRTVSPWTLCADGACHEIGAQAQAPITVAPCGVVTEQALILSKRLPD
ncbi:DUF1850 domain-containing protein [Puniceibacterium sp. IMCC21224]|uniref:DUF1850 domain-containing protein n=1 Tax=Puniceibacterium sp. IMCC21224 TaxID=1618204 RepID=UPI00065CEB9D|nr:DUF1850 domain-containing protein [Puniceibacterium sp. IMCC21224]KMK67104.1 protein of unknown function (DUF1850) [Puniceibacterium sp. IMCC21224]